MVFTYNHTFDFPVTSGICLMTDECIANQCHETEQHFLKCPGFLNIRIHLFNDISRFCNLSYDLFKD
jgi:hypothetical protein